MQMATWNDQSTLIECHSPTGSLICSSNAASILRDAKRQKLSVYLATVWSLPLPLPLAAIKFLALSALKLPLYYRIVLLARNNINSTTSD